MNDDLSKKAGLSLNRKINIGFACYAISVGLGIIISAITIFLKLDNYFETILKYYMIVGVPIICFLSWPLMKRKLK